jgi:hypothetical protein
LPLQQRFPKKHARQPPRKSTPESHGLTAPRLACRSCNWSRIRSAVLCVQDRLPSVIAHFHNLATRLPISPEAAAL